MNRPRFHFRGFPEFLDAAADRAGRPELAGPAGRVEALAALSVLCAQAAEADGAEAEVILGRAAEFRDQLRIAFEAAEAMLTTVARACGVEPPAGAAPARPAPAKRDRSRRRSPSQDPNSTEAS